jgi:hypothetical protein
MTKGCKFSLYALGCVGVSMVIEIQTDAYSDFDLTIAMYSIRRLSRVEKENVIVRINPNNFIVCENKISAC